MEIAFLELVEGRTIADGLRRLEQQGVCRVLAVPFFVCSGSTHLEDIQHILGIKLNPELKTRWQPVFTEAEIIWGEAMDAHPVIRCILIERVRELSEQPSEECLLLVAHGNDQQGFKERWEKMLNKLTIGLSNHFGFHRAMFATLLPDTLRVRAERLSGQEKRRVVVVPLFLSEGFYTAVKIPEKLVGIRHAYNGKTYLPHPLVSHWLTEQIRRYQYSD
jgi:sirohydrochlorin ferrochelatase